MGKLIEQYKTTLSKNGYKTPEPNPDEKPQEYLQWCSNQRKIERYQEAFENAFNEVGFSTEQILAALEKTYGTEKKDSIHQEIQNVGKVRDALKYGYIEEHPEVLDKLSEEDKKKFDSSSKFAREKITEWMADGTIPKDVVEKTVVPFYLKEGLELAGEEKEAFLSALEDQLTENQRKAVEEKLGSYVELMDQPSEKWYEHPYAERCEELKNSVPEDIKANEELNKEYLHALDFAAKHLESPVEAYKNEMYARDSKDVAPLETKRNTRIREENISKYKDGKYKDLFREETVANQKIRILNEGREKDYQELRNDSVKVGEQSLKGMKLVLQKMEEMELFKYAKDAAGEDPFKEYAFCKLDTQRRDLQTALDSGDPKAIIEAEKKYEKTWNDLEELFSIAKEYFSQNPTDYPGNMDSIRTSWLPIHFTQDLMTTAQINTLYLMHLKIKQAGITIEEWEKNPSKLILDQSLKNMEDGGFEDLSGKIGKDLDKTLDLIFHLGEYSNYHGGVYVPKANNIGSSRVLEGIIMLDKDKQARNDNVVYTMEMKDAAESILNNEYSKFLYFDNYPTSEKEWADLQQSLENLILVNDQDRNINAMLGGLPETDPMGGIIGETIDPKNYIQKKSIRNEVKADDVIKRAELIEVKVARMEKKKSNAHTKCFTVEDFRLAKLAAFGKYLDAASFMSEDYKKVLLEYNKTAAQIENCENERVRNEAAKIEAQRQMGVANYDGNHLMEEINFAIEDAKLNVHNGSREFSEAEKALAAVADAYRKYQKLDPTSAYSVKKDYLEDLQAKIANADELIDKYFVRKTKQGEMGPNKKKASELDPKSQKRIAAMQRSRMALKSMGRLAGKLDFEVEQAQVTKLTTDLRNADAKRIYDIQKEYDEAANAAEKVDKNSMEFFVAKGSAEAYKALYQLSGGKKAETLQGKDLENAQKAFANLLLDEVLKSPDGHAIREANPKNLYTYNTKLAEFTKSEAVQKVIPKKITKAALRDFLADKQNIEKLHESFKKEVEREKKRDAKAALNAENQKNLDENVDRVLNGGGGRSRSGGQLNTVTRPRSNGIHKIEGPKLPNK